MGDLSVTVAARGGDGDAGRQGAGLNRRLRRERKLNRKTPPAVAAFATVALDAGAFDAAAFVAGALDAGDLAAGALVAAGFVGDFVAGDFSAEVFLGFTARVAWVFGSDCFAVAFVPESAEGAVAVSFLPKSRSRRVAMPYPGFPSTSVEPCITAQ